MTLKSLVPPLALILAVMGTILGGVTTPTEAAGMGATGAALLAVLNRKMTWTVLKQSCIATLKTTSMVMMHIYRGIIPFVILQLIGLTVLAMFPAIITLLPSVFFGS